MMFPRLEAMRRQQRRSRLEVFCREVGAILAAFCTQDPQVTARAEVNEVFINFWRETASFLLDATKEAFLEKAEPIKAEVLNRVTQLSASIAQLERESAELLRRSGDEFQLELNRREANSKSNCAGGGKFQRSQITYTEFKQQLDRLYRQMRREENEFVANKGIAVHVGMSAGNGHALARKIVLWPDGRYFLVTYTLAKVDPTMDEGQLIAFLLEQPVQWTTDSLHQFNKAELQAIEEFKQGFERQSIAA